MKQLLGIFLLALLVSGCADALHLTATRNTADLFMAKVARGDINGAWEMCDPAALSRETLERVAYHERYADLFRNYSGLNHGDGGQKTEGEAFTDVRLAPAAVEGAPGWIANFVLRKTDADWKIIAFEIRRQDEP